MDGPLVISPRHLTKSKLDVAMEGHVSRPERTTSLPKPERTLSTDSPHLGGRRGGRGTVPDEDRGGGGGVGGGVSSHGRSASLGSGGSGGISGPISRESLSSSGGRHMSGAFVGRHYNSGAVTIFTLLVIALLYIFGWSNLPLGSSVSAVRGGVYQDLQSISGLDRGEGPIILVTGGAGYIGSHTSLLLLSEGFRVIIVDNLMNSKIAAIDRMKRLAGSNSTHLHFFKVDLCDKDALESVFVDIGQRVHAVIHFAGLKAVGESVAKPVWYYENNIYGTLNLISLMEKYDCRRLVFSSSATVYGQPASTPCLEDFPLHPENPYGRTKYFIELIFQDLYRADDRWGIILLRYFNPIGAHSSGRLGEDPQGTPNNLMPYLTQVLQGKQSVLSVFGSDYPTPDGTGVRDYIHVMDLASGHISAVRKLEEHSGCGAYNLGTGKGTSVLELVKAMERASGKKIPLAYKDRRPGDCGSIYASTEKANTELNWRAQFDVARMCEDQWRWAEYSQRLQEE